ncbi:MAG: PKD domain-containing protein [Ferruginibacter sp.]|nr:PKD domain-containing protein [Ferruginibacter sp.]
MNRNRIHKRKIMGLDKRVWGVMVIAIILPLLLLSYYLVDKKECLPVDFYFKSMSEKTGNEFLPGETIIFKASSKSDDITWDFGDQSPKAYGNYIIHEFHSAGNYAVNASTGSGCEKIKQVTIKKMVSELGNTLTVGYVAGEEIIGPHSTIAGKEEWFMCMVTASAYAWSVVNYPKMHQTGLSAKFKFPSPGKYNVQVILDNDQSKRYSKEIIVKDETGKPEPANTKEVIRQLIPSDFEKNPNPGGTAEPPQNPVQDVPVTAPAKVEPPKRKTIFISNETFNSFMESVLNDQKDISDFSQYLFYEGATKVQVKGESDFKTFTWLYQELKGKSKKYKLKTVELIRDEHGHVTSIKVEYKIKGIWPFNK